MHGCAKGRARSERFQGGSRPLGVTCVGSCARAVALVCARGFDLCMRLRLADAALLQRRSWLAVARGGGPGGVRGRGPLSHALQRGAAIASWGRGSKKRARSSARSGRALPQWAGPIHPHQTLIIPFSVSRGCGADHARGPARAGTGGAHGARAAAGLGPPAGAPRPEQGAPGAHLLPPASAARPARRAAQLGPDPGSRTAQRCLRLGEANRAGPICGASRA
jgi:hypothetical protein